MHVQNVQHRLGRVRAVRIIGVAVRLRRGVLTAAARVSGNDFRRCVAHEDAVPFVCEDVWSLLSVGRRPGYIRTGHFMG